MANGFQPIGKLPVRRDQITASAGSTPAPFISDSIVVPEARDRLFEALERFQRPDEVKGTLDGSISGDLRLQTALFDAMLDTWPRLAKNIGEVKRAVRKAPWKFVPWSRRGEKPTPESEALAKDVEDAAWSMRPDPKTGLKGFEGTAEELSVGYWYGHGVSEIHWERQAGRIAPKGTMNVPSRFYGYPFSTEGIDRLMLDPSGGKQGFMNLVDFPENRFLIGVNGIHRGHPTTAAPLRALVGYWIACIYGLRWFMEFAQRFGQPIRWANYETGDTKAKSEILKMMELIGSGGYGVFPGSTELKLVESSKGAASLPSYELLKLADEQCDIFILGQSLTSSQGDKGSQALGKVHMEVRQDVVEGVCDFVGEILTHQLSPAIVALNHGKRSDTPGIWAVFEKPRDLKAEAERIAVILNDVGLADSESGISEAYVYESLAVPIPSAGEKRFTPAPKPEPVQLGPDGLPLPLRAKKPQVPEKNEMEEEPGQKPKKIEASAADYLRNALAMLENNAPINAREGDLEQAEVERRDAEDIRRVLANEEPTTLEKLSGAVLEGLTGTQAEWLAPVRPWFDKLLAAVADETATEEDFEETLRKAHRELPELFGVLDTQALQEAMENAIGSAMLAGGVSRYEKK